LGTLFRLFALRHLLRARLRSLLGLIAVGLGVALFVASTVSITGVRRSMEDSLAQLAGRTEWQVTRGTSYGIEEGAVERIRAIPGAIAAPVIQVSTPLVKPSTEMILILGVDFQTDSMLRLYRFQGNVDPLAFAATALSPNGVAVTAELAAQNGLRVGAPMRVVTRRGVTELAVTGIMQPEGPAAAMGSRVGLMELHAAQRAFGTPGRVSRIDVAGVSREQILAACPGTTVQSSRRMTSAMQVALARIESLTALGMIALLVGLFIIYTSMQVAVVERFKEIGTLRSVGATRGQMLASILLEPLALGVVGSILGVFAGTWLARSLVGYTIRTINAMVMLVDAAAVRITPEVLIAGMALGIITSFAAAFVPALGAVRVSPLLLLRPHPYRRLTRQLSAFWTGAALVIAGAGLMPLIPATRALGLVSVAMVVVGVALSLPTVVSVLAIRLRGVFARLFRVEGWLALNSLAEFPQRTALTAIVLGSVLAIFVATGTLVEGFKTATHRWLDEVLPFDLSIMASDLSTALYREQTVPRSVLLAMRRVPDVELVYGVRTLFTDYRGSDVMVIGVESGPYLEMERRREINGWIRALDDPARRQAFEAGREVYVSGNFASTKELRRGLRIQTPAGPSQFAVAGVHEDYSWPRGVIFMDLDVLQRLWSDDALSYVDLSLKPGVSKEKMRSGISQMLAGKYQLSIFDKSEIRKASDEILGQVVAVANVLAAVAGIIGFLGILNSLFINVLQRVPEIGLLRSMGATRAQVARSVGLEGLFVAITGGLIGAAGGVLGGWLPLRNFAFAITGYLYPCVVPWAHVMGALASAILIGVAASAAPAWRAAGIDPLEAIGYE
jgi:putative ABC transport system permease protein